MMKKTDIIHPTILNLHKPAGITSYDVIRHIKRALPKKTKIGHFGTLDPFASGVLLVSIGKATRLNDYIHGAYQKTYIGIGKFGIQTDTADITGQIVNKDETPYLETTLKEYDKEFITERLQSKFLGKYMQIPPAYSATKFQGKALHQWAREGVTIKKEPVEREIFGIEVVKYSFPYISFRVTASSGTYIRTLFEDIAKQFGTFGTLIGLVREQIGPFSVKNSMKRSLWISEDPEVIFPHGTDVEVALPFQAMQASDQDVARFLNGNPITKNEYLSEHLLPDYKDRVWIQSEDKTIGLGQVRDDKIWPIINFGN